MMQQTMVAARGAAVAAGLLVLLPATVAAHSGVGPAHGFTHGFTHPLLGGDHVLAMVAVGLWAAQLGGRARWLLPCVFVAVLAAGGMTALSGIALPAVEAGIILSVVVLGIVVALALRAPAGAAGALVALFALFHGHAHGAALPAGLSAAGYAAGFMLATAALHGAGLAFALLAQRGAGTARVPLVRAVGTAIGVAGVAIWLL
jgi:urease accessory protein